MWSKPRCSGRPPNQRPVPPPPPPPILAPFPKAPPSWGGWGGLRGRRRTPPLNLPPGWGPLRKSTADAAPRFRHSCAGRNPGDLVTASRPRRFDGLPKRPLKAVERPKRERTVAVRLDSCLRRNDGSTGAPGTRLLQRSPRWGETFRRAACAALPPPHRENQRTAPLDAMNSNEPGVTWPDSTP